MKKAKLILLLFSSAASWPSLAYGANDPCDQPSAKKAAEAWGEACENAANAQSCGIEPQACDKAKDEDRKAVQVVADQYRLACAAVQTYNNAKNACTASCNTALAGALAKAKAELNTAEANLSAEIQKLKDKQKALADEIQDTADNTTCSSPAGRSCLRHGHRVNSCGEDEKAQLDKMSDNPDDKNQDSGASRITKGYGGALKALNTSIEHMNTELDAMKKRELSIGTMLAGNQKAAADLKSNPDDSTITGNSSTSTSASTTPSSGGGGSGSGSGSGGSGSSPGSSISNASDTNMNTSTGTTTGDNSGNGSPSAGNGQTPPAAGQKGGVTNNLGAAATGTPSPDQPAALPSGAMNAGVAPVVSSSRGFPGSQSGASYGSSTGAASPGGGGSLGSASVAPDTKAASPSAAKGATAASGGGSGGGGSGGGGGGPAGGDDSLSPFSKPLSDPKFTLAGSETDASVKKMIGALSADGANGTEAGRSPASEEVVGGIGDREGADLFDRVHSYHERCQQKGCVAGLHRRKMGGV